MMRPDRKQALAPENGRVIESETIPRKQSGIDEDGSAQIKQIKGELDDRNSRCKTDSVQNSCVKIDINRIRDAIKRKRCERSVNKKVVHATDDEIDTEAWIESELENGVELEDTSAKKKQRL